MVGSRVTFDPHGNSPPTLHLLRRLSRCFIGLSRLARGVYELLQGEILREPRPPCTTFWELVICRS